MDIKTYPLTDDEAAARIKAARKRALDGPVCPTCHRRVSMGLLRVGYVITERGSAALNEWRAQKAVS